MGKMFDVQANQYYKLNITSASGGSVLTNNVESILPELRIYGGTKQNQYLGYNLLNEGLLLTPLEGTVSKSTDSDGEVYYSIKPYTVDGVTVKAALYGGEIVENIKSRLAAGQIGIIVNPKSVTVAKFSITFLDENYNNIRGINMFSDIGAGSSRFIKTSITEDHISQIVYMKILFTATSLNLQRICLVTSNEVDLSSPPAYMPYTGGLAVPSMESPADIITANNNLVLTLRGKNLCDLDYFSAHKTENAYAGYSGPKIYVGTGNYVTVSIKEKLPTGLGTYFTVSYKAGSIGANSSNSYWMYHSTVSGLCRQTVSFKSLADYIYINCASPDNFIKNAGYLQIEIGSTETEYEPYFERSTYIEIPKTVTLDDGTSVALDFARVGNYSDILLVDSVNKSVKYRKYTNERILTGGESISVSGALTNHNRFHISGIMSGPAVTGADGYCTHFSKVSAWSTDAEGIRFGQNNTAVYFYVDKTKISSAAVFKQWLNAQYRNGTPVKVLAHKPIATVYDITASNLGRQLLNIPTKDGYNIIQVHNSDSLVQQVVATSLRHKKHKFL